LSENIETTIKEITRGTVEIISEGELRQKFLRSLKSKKPLRVKAGFDPTAPDIHLGHTVLLEKLRQFQEHGHRVIFLIGDFTGMVGDPTGANTTRPMLSCEEVIKNAETYKQQAFKILNPEQTEVRFNSEWLGKFSAIEMLRLCRSETVARMLERDDFSIRFKKTKPIYIHEFIYPLLQGYDSVALEADIEIGGTDQKFNLLMGRTIQKEFAQKPQVIITLPLLMGTDGIKKMSKSTGNYIGINEQPYDIFGKIMSISDELMWNYYELLSRKSMEEISRMKKNVKEGGIHPLEAKEALAHEIVTHFHSSDYADSAKAHFESVFRKRKEPESIPVLELKKSDGIQDIPSILTMAGMAQSKSEAKRLIRQGAVAANGKKIGSESFKLENAGEYLLKVGKLRFLRVILREN